MAISQASIEGFLARYKRELERRRAPSTTYHYVWIARIFLSKYGLKPSYTRREVLDFVDSYPDNGYSQWVYYGLRRLFRSLEIEFPLDSDDKPQIRPSTTKVPVASDEQIRGMIEAALKHGDPEWTCYMALSTTYGLRVGEIQELVPRLEPQPETILVRVEKSGTERKHLVPPEIRAYLRPIRRRSLSHFTNVYGRVVMAAGSERQYGEGYHAIRRALDTRLLNSGLELPLVANFMRWGGRLARLSPAFAMPVHYYHPDVAAVDQAVFKVHPFIRFWSDGS